MEERKATKKIGSDIFTDLFVLEIANNHWGDVDRGLRIIREYGKVVEKYGIKAAVKFQFRDVDTFVHPDFRPTEVKREDAEVTNTPGKTSRYIKKTVTTELSKDGYRILLEEVRNQGMIPMATPFDERSVDTCEELGVEIVKIASQDATDWTLIEKVADLGKTTIISNGGTPIEEIDAVVELFEKKGVPLGINHCVSLYPSEDDQVHINQIDLLVEKYPNHVIGYSTHEYHDWTVSIVAAYAKGARMFERHVDIQADEIPVSPYCSLPQNIDEWFRAFRKVKEMLGPETKEFRGFSEKESSYIRSVSRGVYAKRDLPEGYVITRDKLEEDFFLAIPLQENQYSARELRKDIILTESVKRNNPILKK